MRDVYSELANELLRTHMSLTRGCHNLDIDPKLIEPNRLSVSQCDDCGVWDKPSRMISTYDDSIVCKLCIDNIP